MFKHQLKALAVATVALLAITVACAAPPPMSPTDMLSTIEKTLYGANAEGAVIPRIERLEKLILAKDGEGTLSERVTRLWERFGGGREGVLSHDYGLKLSQWLVYGKVGQESLLQRLSLLEISLFGFPGDAPLPERIEKTVAAAAGKIDAQYAKLTSGTQITVVLRTPLKSSVVKPGDKVTLEVSENVFISDRLAIPSGTVWQAVVNDPTKSNKYDLKNMIEITSEPLPAIDATPVRLYVDDASAAATQVLSGIVMSQGERPERIGFFGTGIPASRIVTGGKGFDLAEGARFVLAVREDVSVAAAKVR